MGGRIFGWTLAAAAGSPVSPSGITAGKAIRRAIEPSCRDELRMPARCRGIRLMPRDRDRIHRPRRRHLHLSGPGAERVGAGPHAGQHQCTPTFRFTSSEPESRFECKLDGKRFRSCASPLTTKRLALGAHRFQVRAVGHDGAKDLTPASCRFRVIRPQS
jgi:hypothetical protein